jgi:hypothetical protein
MPEPVKIDPDAIYDENAVCLTLGFTYATLKRARQSEGLRHTRKGHRNLYLGQWVIDWLSGNQSLAGASDMVKVAS